MDSERHFSLVKTIQGACTAPAWAQGKKLAQRKLVEGISASEEEITLRIHLPAGGADPTVVLYPRDDEWECDCLADDDNCAHVAAAAIAMDEAWRQGERLPVSAPVRAKLEYRFTRRTKGLSLSRVIVAPDGAVGLVQSSLIQAVQNRTLAFGLKPSPMDLEVDRFVGRNLHPQRPLRPDTLMKVVAALAGASNVFLDDQPVPVSDEPLYPMISIANHGEEGVALLATANPDVEDLVAPGLALCAGTLHAIGEQGLCGQAMEKLPRTIVYERAQLAGLVLEILPHLEEQGCVTIKSNRLPGVSRFLEPRLVMNMQHAGRAVSVLPELVYGAPPCVRVEGEQLHYLEGAVPIRDRQAERVLLEKLRGELNLVPGRTVTFSGKEAGQFMERARRFGEDTLDSSQQILTEIGPLRALVHVNDDEFEVSFVAGGETEKGPGGAERTAEALNVLSAWQEGMTMAPLLGGGFASLPTGWLDAHGDLVADILAARSDDNKVATAALPMLAQLCDELELPRQPCFDRLAPLLENFESIPEAPLPGDLTATLRPYQKQGVDWLCFLRSIRLGAVLADDMGLGKTLQALCAIDGRALVVCPTSVLHNWAAEIDRFRPDLTYSVYHGPGRELGEEATVTLTTYALLRMDVEVLRQEKWEYVILDEAQHIKNPGSMVSRAAFKLDGKLHIAMSGTPVENRLDELWSLFNFVNRGLLGSQSDFQKRYAVPIGFGDPAAGERLRQRIAPFVLRRLKQNVEPELPPRTDQVLECELNEQERDIYTAIKATTEKEIVQKLSEGGGVMAALEALLRLRQASCHSSLVPGQASASSSKVALLCDRLEHTVANEHKALVFSQWTSLLDLVEPHLDAASIDYCRLDGSTRDRGAVVARFQDAAGPPVMLISLKAGGTGLNLTAADHVFLLDPWWNPAVEDQAADRTHRIGQDKPVMVYRLVAQDTVEERILELQEKKRKLADVALGEAERAVSLTREDLLALLE